MLTKSTGMTGVLEMSLVYFWISSKNFFFFHIGCCIHLKSDHIYEFKENQFSKNSEQAALKYNEIKFGSERTSYSYVHKLAGFSLGPRIEKLIGRGKCY